MGKDQHGRQGCVSRLGAAGIVRDEAETPWEFLVLNEEELERLTEPAGIGRDEWALLTDAYERARYAGVGPSESELATCLRIYDALPGCTRRMIGWYGYLTDAFWRM